MFVIMLCLQLSLKEKEFLDIELQLVHLKDAHESLKTKYGNLKTVGFFISVHIRILFRFYYYII